MKYLLRHTKTGLYYSEHLDVDGEWGVVRYAHPYPLPQCATAKKIRMAHKGELNVETVPITDDELQANEHYTFCGD